MANTLEVRKQLHVAGFRNKHWGWAAIRQLPMILEENEVIKRCVSGLYQDGYAIMLATDRRVLFLDKKLISFRAEDIRYEMISEVEHYLGPVAAKLRIHCLSKSFELKSLHPDRVQAFAIHVEQTANQYRLHLSNSTPWSQAVDSARPVIGVEAAPRRMPLPRRNIIRNQ